MQQPHRQILRGPSLQVNAVGAGFAFDLNFRVTTWRHPKVLSEPGLRQRTDPIPSHPIRTIRSGCCARAASGQDAAPPTSVMKSRRCMFDPRLSRRYRNGSNKRLDRGRNPHLAHFRW